jgi:hypothetical protein
VDLNVGQEEQRGVLSIALAIKARDKRVFTEKKLAVAVEDN